MADTDSVANQPTSQSAPPVLGISGYFNNFTIILIMIFGLILLVVFLRLIILLLLLFGCCGVFYWILKNITLKDEKSKPKFLLVLASLIIAAIALGFFVNLLSAILFTVAFAIIAIVAPYLKRRHAIPPEGSKS